MSRLIDLTGQTFGRLKVLRRIDSIRPGQIRYECQCMCDKHTIVSVSASNLRCGHVKSCGCLKAELDRNRLNDLTGKTFGRLSVIKRASVNSTDGYPQWICKCTCGNTCTVTGYNLVSGATKSCGCLNRELTIKRFSKWTTDEERRIRNRFSGMIQRCYNPNNPGYISWGGRGITICKEWLDDPSKFVDWAKSNGFDPSLWIERNDNNDGYKPSNCSWETAQRQQNNKRTSIHFEINGVTHTISEWSEISGINYQTLVKQYHTNPQRFMDSIVASRGYSEYVTSIN